MTFEIKNTDAAEIEQSFKKLKKIILLNFFIKDVELIDEAIITKWQDHSSYKNWNKGSWLLVNHFNQLYDFNISVISNEELYYNLTWEHRFIYEQFNIKIKALKSVDFFQIDLINAYKNIADIENLNNFLTGQKTVSRQKTLDSYKFYADVFKLNLTESDKNKHLDFIVNRFSIATNVFTNLIIGRIGYLYGIQAEIIPDVLNENIKIFGQKTFFIQLFSLKNFHECFEKYPEAILITPELYRLYKLFGIQEISPILAIMDKPTFSFLKNYLITRLIQDYLQAIFDKKEELVLFYCRKNLDSFFYSRLSAEEALSFSKRKTESDLEHYVRARDRLVQL